MGSKYLQEMKETPQQPDPSRPGLAIRIKVNIDPPHEESPAPAEGPVGECDRQIRRVRIAGVMLQKYGYTVGCDGCRHKRLEMREARPHTEAGRRRIGKAMMGDETDRRKKEEDDERVNWRLAEKMEKILKEKQETAETIEKELEEVTIEQEPEEVKQEPEEVKQGGQEAHGAGQKAREEARAGQRQRRGGAVGVKGRVQEERNEDCRTPQRCRERTGDRER